MSSSSASRQTTISGKSERSAKYWTSSPVLGKPSSINPVDLNGNSIWRGKKLSIPWEFSLLVFI